MQIYHHYHTKHQPQDINRPSKAGGRGQRAEGGEGEDNKLGLSVKFVERG